VTWATERIGSLLRRAAVKCRGYGWRITALLLAATILQAPDLASGAEPSAASSAEPSADAPNGFLLSDLRVPRDEIREGGPARDAIHSVDEPEFVPHAEATWVRGETPVIGLELDGEAHCYPVHVMEYHQIVNDTFGERRVALTYDPLTDSAIAYVAGAKGAPASFGVSGLIYQSNFLLYDRQSESLWSQMTGEAIAGPRSGQTLQRLRVRVEPMAIWHRRHPETRVLARPDKRRIDYRLSPYSAYWISEKLAFPVSIRDERFHPKELVLGAVSKGGAVAYLASMIEKAGGQLVDEIEGQRIRVVYEGETGTFSFEAPEALQITQAYWFAWKAFHPATRVWSPPTGDTGEPGEGAKAPDES
jgi:hypothetical protein